MSENDAAFASLMRLVAQRDNQAIAQLYHRYNDTLLSYLRQHLRRRPRLRTLFDADWLANGLWWDLLRHPAKCKQFATPAQLVGYLRGMARNQVSMIARDHLDAQKRDLRLRRHLSDRAVTATACTVADPRPTPAQHAEHLEDWDRWLLSLTHQEQQLVLLRRAGCTLPEIAAELDCSGRTLERMTDKLRYRPPPDPILDLCDQSYQGSPADPHTEQLQHFGRGDGFEAIDDETGARLPEYRLWPTPGRGRCWLTGRSATSAGRAGSSGSEALPTRARVASLL